jgi:hypothetical protein
MQDRARLHMDLPIDFDRDKCVGREAEIIDALLRVAFMLSTALVGVKAGVVPAGSANAAATMLCDLMNESLPDLNFRVVTTN